MENLSEKDVEKVIKHMERANIYLKSSLENRNQAVSIMMDCAYILSIDEIKWLLEQMENRNISSNTNHNSECTTLKSKAFKNAYKFLQEHKEIQSINATSKQLEEMLEIDKKFKQLGDYSINKTATDAYWISFNDVLGVKIGHDFVTNISDFNKNIYICYFNTFNELKKSEYIVKHREQDGNKFKWDGENFKEISKSNMPTDTIEEDKSVNAENKPTNIIVNVDGVCVKEIQEKVEKLIVNHWLEIFGIEETITAPKPIKTIKDELIEEEISKDAVNFRDKLLKYIDKHLKELSNAKVHITPLEDLNINSKEELDEKINILVGLRDKVHVDWTEFIKIPENEILEPLNKYNLGRRKPVTDFLDFKREINTLFKSCI